VKSADEAAELRELVARVSRQVARRTGKPRPELAEIVAAEVTAALASSPRLGAGSSSSPAGAAPPAGRAASLSVRAELCASCLEQERRKSGRRAVVTTTGKNRKGMVAKIAQGIADSGGDILDISQTLVADYFTMIIVVDVTSLDVPFTEFKARITETVRALGAECLVMHEDVVTALQRI
jgi:ACT domain-containing protein